MNLEDLKEAAFNNLKNCAKNKEDFLPVALIGNKVIGIPFTNDNMKVEMLRMIGKMAAQDKVDNVIIILDSYVRVIDNKNDAKEIVENWDLERPSMYPENMRQSCLILSQIFFDGTQKDKLIMIPYTIDGYEVILKEEEIISEEGTGLIKDSLLKGYNSYQ